MKRVVLAFLLCACLVHPLALYAQHPAKAGKQFFRAAARRTVQTGAEPVPNLKELRRAARIPSARTTRLLGQNIQKKLSAARPPWQGRIFKISVPNEPNIVYSGTVFKTQYNGKEEIYGVIATHAVSLDAEDITCVTRRFTATFFRADGSLAQIPAESVAFSPIGMLDIALVKFPKEAEPFLRPYPLGQPGEETVFHSQGYNDKELLVIPDRKLLKILPYSIRTAMPILETSRRRGLCGSPLLNSREELVGIHTGTAFDVCHLNNASLCSYATPSRYLNFLVEAYHNGGKAKVPFYLDENRFVSLNVDEYLAGYKLLDARGRTLYTEESGTRPSRKELKTALQQYPQATFLLLTTHRLAWNRDNSVLPVYFAYEGKTPQKNYLYHMQTGKQWQLPRFSSWVYRYR